MAPTSITSLSNPRVKYVRSLHDARARRQEGVYFVEGVRLVEEALRAGVDLRLALVALERLESTDRGRTLLARLQALAAQGCLELLFVSERVMQSVSDTVTPAGVLAVVPMPSPADREPGPFVLVLDGLQDPGNAGTILRSAEASGVVSVVAAVNSVDMYSPKVVRAAAGAHFYLSIWTEQATWPSLLGRLGARPILATRAHAGVPYYDVNWNRDLALVMGSEAHGLSSEAEAAATEWVTIPMPGHAESLNASVAASILVFEAARKRVMSNE